MFEIKKIMKYLILLVFITIQQLNPLYSQHILLKSNPLNLMFVYPSLDVEYQISHRNSIGIHNAMGTSYFNKPNENYYSYYTSCLDYFYNINGKENLKTKVRLVGYCGYINRRIQQDEKFLNDDSWLLFRVQRGRNFSGNAIRSGLGFSILSELSSKISIEENIGLGYGYYLKQNDIYYKDYYLYSASNPPVKFHSGFFDFRFAINICYKLF